MADKPEARFGAGLQEYIPFDNPVSLTFAADGTMYVVERLTGRLFAVKDGQKEVVYQFQVPHLEMHHELGALGLALHPDPASRAIYVYHTIQQHQDPWHNRISRINLDSGEEEIIANLPAAQIHNGGIMAFGPDGKLYIGIGDLFMYPLAQVREFPAGKVLRMNDDGSVPDDNPYPGSYTYAQGFRNVFGLAFHPTSGQLFLCDVGSDHDDEINIITKGGNYGWPLHIGKARQAGFIDPIHTYRIVVTPTQCFFANEREFYFGSFNFGEVHRLTLGGPNFSHVVKDEVVYYSRPFGVIGAFISPQGDFHIIRPEGVGKVQLQSGVAYDRPAA